MAEPESSHHASVGPHSTYIQVTLLALLRNSFSEASIFVGVKYKNHFPNHESGDRGHLGHVQLTAGNNQVGGKTRSTATARHYSSFLLLFLSFLFACKLFRSDITFKVFCIHIITMTIALNSNGAENTIDMNIPRESKY